MIINLNNPDELTIESVAELIRSGDDSINTQFCVTKAGYFYLCNDVTNLNHDELLFRLEQNDAGNDYVGELAAYDELWVATIFSVIEANLPKPLFDYIDDFSPFAEAISNNLIKIKQT
jgi:hypothetical protein